MFGKNKEDEASGHFYTVFDSKTKSYGEPFPAPNNAVLVRDFENAFRRPEAAEKNRYYLNAEDFSIFRCGSFNLKTGELQGCSLEHVANCHDIRAMVDARKGPAGPGH